MAKFNISQAAKAVGVSRKTVQRHIQQGKVSCEKNGNGQKLIDTSELLRAYGKLKENVPHDTVGYVEPKSYYDTPNDAAILEEKIRGLERENEVLRQNRNDLKQLLEEEREALKEERRERQQTLRLLEDKRSTTEQPQAKNTIPARVLWIFLPLCVVIAAVPVIAWLLLSFLKH